MNGKEMLLRLSQKYSGNWEDIYEDIKEKETKNLEEINVSLDSDYISILDNNYPTTLKNSIKPPFVLYYRGNIGLLNSENTISINGSRETNINSLNEIEKLICSLCAKNTLVENLNNGTNYQAISFANSFYSVPTIVVLPCSFDSLSEEEKAICDNVVKRDGLVITEYPYGTQKTKENYPFSKRIVGALADKIVIVSGKKQSALNILVNYALSLNKSIYCIPHPFIEEDLCNDLIESGAIPLVSTRQILEAV